MTEIAIFPFFLFLPCDLLLLHYLPK
jgi:hypothetical protein